MDDAVVMGVVDRMGDLDEQANNGRGIYVCLMDESVQVAPVDEIHYQKKRTVLGSAAIQNADYVRMIESRQNSGLASYRFRPRDPNNGPPCIIFIATARPIRSWIALKMVA